MENATCGVDGCHSLAIARGWCNTHYLRWRRNGDPSVYRTRWTPDGSSCVHETCSELATVKQMCARHYAAEYHQRVIAPRRTAWIASRGGRCERCGSQERLEVDHRDPSTKEREIASIWALSHAVREAELAKCQLLCRACHESKTRAEFPVQHGTINRWRKGCRCTACHDAMLNRGRADRAWQKTRAAS